jgi:hypothetical protein
MKQVTINANFEIGVPPVIPLKTGMAQGGISSVVFKFPWAIDEAPQMIFKLNDTLDSSLSEFVLVDDLGRPVVGNTGPIVTQ